MAKIIGRTGSVGIAVEQTRGTSLAPTYWVPIQGIDFDDKVEYVDNDSAMGRIEEKNEADIIKRWGEGSYEGKIYDKSVGVELTALFGQEPTSTQRTTTGVYDHVYTLLNSNQHASLCVGYKDANEDVRYALAMINSWSLEVELDNYVRRTVELISKKSASASNTVAITNENEFIPKHIVFKMASALAGLDGASAGKIRNFNLEINKNVEALYVLGSIEPDDIVNKQFAVTGSFEAFMEDTTTRAYVMDGTERAMRIDIVSDVVVGSSGSHTPALRFDLAKVKMGEFERGWDMNDIMTQTINFEGLFSIADTSLITGRLTNAYAGGDYAIA